MRLIVLLILGLLTACGQTPPNAIQIGSGGPAIRADGSGLFINSSLLGLEPGTTTTIDTSSSNEITFDVGRSDSQRSDVDTRGSAF